MTTSFNHRLFLFCILILSAEFSAEQIIIRPDSNLSVSGTKSILAIMPCKSGSFYLNDFYLTDIPGNDTAFIYGPEAGNFTVKFIADSVSCHRNLAVHDRKIYTIVPCDDSISLQVNKLFWDEAISSMTGNKYYKPRGKYFYNITQIALLNLNASSGDLGSLNSINTINGYQIAPGIAMGLGIAYNYYTLDMMGLMSSYHYPYGGIEDGHVPFLPVYFDLRFHPASSSRLTSPFIKFAIGYNILLQRREFHADDPTYNYLLTMDKGGIFLSPGIGFRIFINGLVQIIVSIDYSFEKSVYYYGTYRNDFLDNKLHLLKLNLGIGFQYKHKRSGNDKVN